MGSKSSPSRALLRRSIAIVVAVVGVSLVGAPVTMADWSEQSSFSVERIEDPSQVRNGTPVLQYEALPSDAQRAVERAIDSSDGGYTIYGFEDAPDRFYYGTDHVDPGEGLYVVDFEDRYYELTTVAGGGFQFVYWILELPFVLYGLLLVGAAYGTYRGRLPIHLAVLAAIVGAGFHVIGPVFDFPLITPIQFAGLGVLAVVGGFGFLREVRGRGR